MRAPCRRRGGGTTHCRDSGLDCGGGTFEDAIVSLACLAALCYGGLDAWLRLSAASENGDAPLPGIGGPAKLLFRRGDRVRTGETVLFGSCPQASSRARPSRLRWIVADVRDGMALLLCERAVGSMPYSDSPGRGWADSLLREWLNGAFLRDAFTDCERPLIPEVEIGTPLCDEGALCDYARGSTPIREILGFGSGWVTRDRAFLLGLDEMERLGLAPERLACAPAPLALERGAWVSSAGACAAWWLRTVADHGWGVEAYTAGPTGYAQERRLNFVAAVRPALWARLPDIRGR